MFKKYESISYVEISGSFYINTTSLQRSYVGSLVGKAAAEVVIISCKSSLNITSSNNYVICIGGLVALAYNNLTVTSCIVNVELRAYGDVGGFVSEYSGFTLEVNQCQFIGNISSNNAIGAVVALLTAGNMAVTNFTQSGWISS